MEIQTIGYEELEVLNELESLGMLFDNDELADFRSKVCGVAKCYQEISEDDFERAFNQARTILGNRGEAVFRKHLTK